MEINTWIIVFAAHNLVLVVCVFFLWKRYKGQKLVLEQKKQEEIKRLHYIFDSLRTLCMVGIDRQCDHAEVCIRFAGLVDAVEAREFSGFEKEIHFIKNFSSQVEHFARGENRSDLSFRDRMQEDKTRWKIEEENDDEFRAHLRSLLKHVEARAQALKKESKLDLN